MLYTANLLTIRQAVARCKSEGMPVSEYALRSWVRDGVITTRKIGTRNLIFYPDLIAYLTHSEAPCSIVR